VEPSNPVRPSEARPSDTKSPAVKPPSAKPATTKPDPISKPGIESKAPSPRAPSRDPDVSAIARKPSQFLGDEAFGVPLRPASGLGTRSPGQPSGAGGRGSGTGLPVGTSSGNTTIQNNTYVTNNTYVQYVNNVSRFNGWWPGGGWSSCGPVQVWQPYVCNDGLSVSIGFGSGGFSFGFFYGSSGAPFCSSWSNPWWEGYCSSWSWRPACAWAGPCWPTWCGPWYRGWWNPCRPLWAANWCAPAPAPCWTPCFTYSPFVCSTVYAPSVTYVSVAPPPAPPPPPPSPVALFAMLANGYDVDAEAGFAELAAIDPGESAWVLAQGFGRAFRGEVTFGADAIRNGLLRDPSGLLRLSSDARFVGRLEALELTLTPLATGATPSVDAMLLIAATQAARGELSSAFFTASSARGNGDRTPATSAFIAWLQSQPQTP